MSLASTPAPRLRFISLLPAAIACAALVPATAWAAALSAPITGWSTGVPSYISMYEYVPDNVTAAPPIVVAAHYCGGSASAFFSFASTIVAAADRYGFIMIFPQTTNAATSAKCWEVGSKASLTHEGGGDTQAIAQMVRYEIAHRGADANRVYIMGASSGAMLTEAMLAVYPDVFKAGSEFSGVPAGCWSDGWSAASNWGGVCATGGDLMTGQQWGDLVRGMFPGYTGYRPRIQLWHGTADTTINFNNQGEAIKEWTNVLGLNAAASSTDSTSVAGFTIQKWQNSCGFTVLEAHTQANGGHTTPIDATSVISFFGLDKPAPDPQPAACGTSGSGGSTGNSGAGGRIGTGGRTGDAGVPADAGPDVGVDGNRPRDAAGSGGATGTGSGGSGTGGGMLASTGGASGQGGATGAVGTGGAPGPGDTGSSGGCACTTAGAGGGGASIAFLAVALTLTLGRRSRRRR